ncbi:hypothetical protein BASA81_009103 [Batrachochytrium salamandrivorans]|nr:hypothetical protein BASA81_009103 [Batrachochytrium salamandrivorans]
MGLLKVEVVEGRVCLVTLLNDYNGQPQFPWGTSVAEHRLNFLLMGELNAALDLALSNPEVSSVVVTGQGKFFSNGMDLQFLDAHLQQANAMQKQAELLLARLLGFPLPTVAAINGHFCAAGAMFGLAFDFRIMTTTRGLFFVPGVDIGLAYSPGMTSLLKSKLPVHMHVDMICFAKRYTAKDLLEEKLLFAVAPTAEEVVRVGLQHALMLTGKTRFLGPKYRDTLGRIKQNTFADTLALLLDETTVFAMGFEAQAWGDGGRSRI